MVSGRHSWSCVVEEFAGKGFLLVGIVRDPDAADAAALALCHLAVSPMHQKLIAAGAESIHGRARSRKSA